MLEAFIDGVSPTRHLLVQLYLTELPGSLANGISSGDSLNHSDQPHPIHRLCLSTPRPAQKQHLQRAYAGVPSTPRGKVNPVLCSKVSILFLNQY